MNNPRTRLLLTRLLIVVGIPLLLSMLFGSYIGAIDGVLLELILQRRLGIPIENWYIVSAGINRFLFDPLLWLYDHYPNIAWVNLSQFVSSFIAYTLLTWWLTKLLYKHASKIVATILSVLLCITFAELVIVVDPFTSAILMPLIVLVLPGNSNNTVKWFLVPALMLLMLHAFQSRFHGVLIGITASIPLLLIINGRSVLKKHATGILILISTGSLFLLIANQQDQNLTVIEQRIRQMDEYVYTLTDTHIFDESETDITQAADSIKLVAYSTFYFPESLDSSLVYLDKITTRNPTITELIGSFKIKWEEFTVGLFNYSKGEPFLNYGRFVIFLVFTGLIYLLYIFTTHSSWQLRICAIIWYIATIGLFFALGVIVKMVYRVALPLTILSLAGWLWIAIRSQNNWFLKVRLLTTFMLMLFLGLSGYQLYNYSIIHKVKQANLSIKQASIQEINESFTASNILIDMASLTLFEKNLFISANHSKLQPTTIMFGDFYMRQFPENQERIKQLTGTDSFEHFFKYWEGNPEDIILVLDKSRASIIEAYLSELKGMDIWLKPVEGDFNIEQLKYSFYNAPLQLNYYKVQTGKSDN